MKGYKLYTSADTSGAFLGKLLVGCGINGVNYIRSLGMIVLVVVVCDPARLISVSVLSHIEIQ